MRVNVENKTILITGGTGSLGSRSTNFQKHKPKIIVFSRDEMKQWEMVQYQDDDNVDS